MGRRRIGKGDAPRKRQRQTSEANLTPHRLFYYPYASLTNQQLPLLKVAALYFDKLVILDPVGASWDTIGTDHAARDAVTLLKDAGILELVTPADVLAQYAGPLAEAVRRDMADPAFLDLCDAHVQASGRRKWTLALAKVPWQLQADEAMRELLGNFAREMARRAGQLRAEAGWNGAEYGEYGEHGQVFDENREGYEGQAAYRYADFPLALGEAIMMNHALFAGLLHSNATPITDDAFHSQVLAHKLERIAQEPVIRQALASRASQRQLKADTLAASVLTDAQVELPILNCAVPLADVLEYREQNPDALARVRDTLGQVARRIEAEPWSGEFAREIETKTIPDLKVQLTDAAKARNAWLATPAAKSLLKGAGLAAGAASAVLAFVAAPLAPVALAAAGIGIVSGSVIPGAEWLLDWREQKQTMKENGLHYLLRTG